MASQKPSIPKGTRDFGPVEMTKRNYIFDTIREVFTNYGFAPIETPAMENLSTLMGKYGEEGDKLLFKILNSGDYLKKADETLLSQKESTRLTTQISEKGLRYDLTVPFARFVVQHQHEISFPFKRFQIQSVWRADRPQKGRYREFYQCDADIVGSNSLMNETELIQIIEDVFHRLGIPTLVKINNRKILAGIAEILDASDKLTDITVAIDKLDKIGYEKVKQELSVKGLSNDQVMKLDPILKLEGSNLQKLHAIEQVLMQSETGLKGVRETQLLFELLQTAEVHIPVELDLTLARGLNYYTGSIIEVKAKDIDMGSICGGGRYDDLTGIFGLPDVSGVGISFGAERIFDVLEHLDLYPQTVNESTKVMFTNFGEKEQLFCLKIAKLIRQKGIRTEIFPDSVKMKKQMNYADQKNIPFVAIVGTNEMEQQKITLKNMNSGEQELLSIEEFMSKISQPLLIKK
ncbi:MAG: histidine--tRNA ligase [Bacteroidetes bacterium]|jgi:histidyl-tRNA synthetase|nr:histidine--tRNA ligase [Bacteroidota bacterium]